MLDVNSSAAGVYKTLGTPMGPERLYLDRLPALGTTLEKGAAGVFNNPWKNDASSEGGYIDQQYTTPVSGYNYFAEMREGQLAFCIRIDPGEPGTTFILTLPQLNKLMREQWDDFVMSTSGSAANNPRFDSYSRVFLNYMQNYGEHGLQLYEKLVYAGKANDPKYGNLQEYWSMAKEDRFCYLTLYGIRHRVSYLGPIQNMTNSYTLNPVVRDHGQGTIVVGMGQRVECSQIFGRMDEVTHQASLELLFTRMPCHDSLFGSFCVYPRVTSRHSSATFRDESGALCQAYVRHVGFVHTVPSKESSGYTIMKAANTGPSVTSEEAWAEHCQLPKFYINAGLG